MSMPGFTAEASAYKARGHYHAMISARQARATGSIVQPYYVVHPIHPGPPSWPGPQIKVTWQPPPSDEIGPNWPGVVTIEGQYWPAGQSAEDFCINISDCLQGGGAYPPINCPPGDSSNTPSGIKQSAQVQWLWLETPVSSPSPNFPGQGEWWFESFTEFTVTGAVCFCGGTTTVTVTDSLGNMAGQTIAIPCNM